MEENISIGTLLKGQREAKNISLEDIAQKTKININILKSLEQNDLEKLPNRTYVRGFVTNYARAVGLDVEEAKSTLDRSYGITSEKVSEESVEETTTPQQVSKEENKNALNQDQIEDIKDNVGAFFKEVFNKKVIIGVSAVIVLAISAKGITSFIEQLNSEKDVITEVNEEETQKVVTDAPLKDSSENILEMDATKKLAETVAKEEKKESKKEEVEKVATEEPVKTEEKKEVAKVTEEVKKEEKKPEIPEGKLPFRRFYKAPLDIFSIVADAKENNDANLLPPSIKASAIEGKQNVYIVAETGDTWISFKKDSDPIKKFVF